MYFPSLESLFQDAFPTEVLGQTDQMKNMPETKSKKTAEAHDFQVKYKTEVLMFIFALFSSGFELVLQTLA